ncbi:SLC13 family permease [Desulfopila aestuarii]|uniref:TrkA-C domain-containing protein n=1 Tax=Desulfopila aestuarii DSM 18488 TaxID=1121416 RepID=A0A1M7Y9L5_9BACT|nr:SLC13 family permease [Desulfopila aestuarii]SHO49322.1 TrkA-C domain-containing protein [Desulfopila aestuarii DSM 18488]
MTPEILLVFGILIVVIAVLVTEIMPLEVLALLVLGVLAVTGLVSPTEALAGFSNPAVVTIWAVFILSGGLTRTGIANILGRNLLRVAGTGEVRILLIIMTIAGVLSAFMNNVAVAALMLPVVMDIARKTGRPPSLLLMPLAFGSLLGGLTTMIGTPPNILVSEALRTNGLTPFGLFDFTPVGLVVMVVGMLFMAFVAPRLLPRQGAFAEGATTEKQVLTQYRIQERLFRIRIPEKSALIGHTLASSHLGSRLGLNVIGINRGRQTSLAPDIHEKINQGDELIVEGRLDRIQEMNNWGQLLSSSMHSHEHILTGFGMEVAEIQLSGDSPWLGRTLSELGFRNKYGLNVLEIRRFERSITQNVKSQHLRAGDVLVVHGPVHSIDDLAGSEAKLVPVILDAVDVENDDELGGKVRLFSIPNSSRLLGMTVSNSCLGDALDVQILAIIREDDTTIVPSSDVIFEPGDRLVVWGMSDLVAILLMQGLEAVFDRNQEQVADISILENDQVGLVEVILSPYSVLGGQTLQELSFREKFGLTVLAVWRKGKVVRTGLRDLQLQLGDALLLFGPWKKLTVLGKEPDFVVLTEKVQEVAREEKAVTALTIMGAVLVPVIFGWVQIYIAVVIGAACMVLTRCLTMDEAYRYIEWKAVFLIAGMLPLGVALDKTGAASMVAESVIALLGPMGPYGVLFGLLSITFLATSIIPTAALVVLMVPIALKTSAGLGISPYPLMMGIAMSASSSFTSPISHPANVLVMGPGGYRFIDYVKVGVPLTLVILVVLMIVIPIFWPMT